MEERFWAKVDKSSDPNGCWIWTAWTSSEGYGVIGQPGGLRKMYAHRYSAALHFGMFDQRLLVLHHCDNPPCVNPGHLYLGTKSDNGKDFHRRHGGATYQSRKTECVNGHPFAGENLRISAHNGQRVCRECRRTWQRRARDKASA